ncbi:hypothetical protein P6U16_27445 (plasmid) [Rhizobium sp. 32-5/1]|uniref:hypothetical protein n=1 Tax=Rhizobium sp. 32-5/1 TaxID=3019602 RepID=UPI00240E0562|nr:hypothetical protein [Rhizobium sp. 32-5/1]WEZ86285.1 hypothetical protein P6U16_27445 [Rhizobium sp. 32-5/1]
MAEMFRDAARGYWRHNRPQLHNEGAPDNQTPFSTILGLTGLEIETSESMAVLATLAAEEVEIAARYAVSELNGFPSWFATLFEHHPQVVADFLFVQIRYEAFSLPKDRTGDDILSDVSWTGQWAWSRLGPMLLSLLVSGEPQSAKALGSILKILKGSSVADGQLAAMARSHALDPTSANPGHWFASWIGVDADAAIAAFEERLSSLNKKKPLTWQCELPSECSAIDSMNLGSLGKASSSLCRWPRFMRSSIGIFAALKTSPAATQVPTALICGTMRRRRGTRSWRDCGTRAARRLS